MHFVLILYIYAGGWAKGDSVALTTVPGFPSQTDCQTAGKSASALVAGSTKGVRFICVGPVK